MAHEARVTVNVQSPACDVCCIDFIENEYVDITCEEAFYVSLWNRFKSDPILSESLSHIDQVPSTVIIFPGIKRVKIENTRTSILGSIVLTILVYAALAGIAYCIFVGAKTLFQ